ncbi:MAG: M48 family metallopeptidase [Saprospiraceae bacterium]
MVQDIHIPLLNLKVRVIRKNNRRMYLRVKPPDAEVEVTAPWMAGDDAIVAFVEDHAAWLIKARQKVLHEATVQPLPTDTGWLRYLGELHRLSWEYGNPRTEVVRTPGQILVKLDARWKDAARSQLSGVLETWASCELAALAQERLPRLAAQLGVPPPLFQIKKVRSYWGKCYPTRNEILLNLYLVQKSPACIEYVLIHELAHFKQANHGAGFWNLVGLHCPNYRQYEAELRARPSPF